jgi:AcrR family transcriptional regulator
MRKMSRGKRRGRKAASQAERRLREVPPRAGAADVAAALAGKRGTKPLRASNAPGGGSAPAAKKQPKRRLPRKTAPAERRQAILDAALAVFAERGFDAARLDDVAQRAGVAKGTLYLYFRDKEALFEELVRSAVAPLLENVSRAAAAPDVPATVVLEAFFSLFEKEVLGTKRKLLLRLIIAEGPRFPAIAEFYHREVVTRGLQLMRSVAARAFERGEFATDGPAHFPQLIVAPLVLAVIWDSLFAKIAPLDVAALLRAHRGLLTGKQGRSTP